MTAALPYRIAVLCYLFDDRGRVLLLQRRKSPNQGLYSPIGGKLEMTHGESPTDCAVREVREEAGLTLQPSDLHLTGIISEAGYEEQAHWLMFLYESRHPVNVPAQTITEGLLDWHEPATLERLAIPQTDRQVIWPLFWRYRGRFFMAHIQCTEGRLSWTLQQPACDAGPASR